MDTYSKAPDAQQDEEQEPRFWNGIIAFAAFMLVMQGGFHLVGGFVALFEDDQYLVGEQDLVVSVDYTAWGIAHMALAVGMFLTAYALFWRKTWARIVAVVIALVSALTNLAFLSSYPIWFSLMIVVDVLVIYAVTVHGGRDPEYF